MPDWSRLAKLAGMLGSPHDGERLNAARLLQAALDREGVSFGDLASRISNGGAPSERVVYVDREIVRVERPTPNPAADIAARIIERSRHRLTYSERRFLDGIIRNADMTNGQFSLTTQQANWLAMLQQEHLKPRTAFIRERAKPKPVASAMLDELGLGDDPKARDLDDHIGNFRARAAGEASHTKPQRDPRPAGQAPHAHYRGDFLRDPLTDDEIGLDDEIPF